VELLGVFASSQGVADHGVLSDAGEAAGLSDAAAFLEMGEHVQDLVVGESGVEEGCALAFGEAVLAGAASEHTSLLARPVAKGDAEVIRTALAIGGAVGVLAAEAAEVVHRAGHEKVFRDT
jgi:hypothetical protein